MLIDTRAHGTPEETYISSWYANIIIAWTITFQANIDRAHRAIGKFAHIFKVNRANATDEKQFRQGK